MVQLSTLLGIAMIAVVQAAPNLSIRQNLPDPAGEKNIGNGAGIQFIGGQCNGAADCASGCCATLPRGGATIGVCSGVGAQTQAGKQGCGFEAGGAPAGNSANGNGNGANAGGNAGNGNGGGRGGGRGGHGNNGNANNGNANNGNANGNVNNGNANNGNANTGTGEPFPVVPIGAGSTPTVIPTNLKPDPAGEKNIGNGAGGQFITGQCLSDADCASNCCALVNNGVEVFGICSGPGANTQNGKQGCGFPVGGGQL
ncbi:hypothetical protein OQA88_7632 [Cercophora sp. LCS_1]